MIHLSNPWGGMSNEKQRLLHKKLSDFLDFLHYCSPSIDDQLSFVAENTFSSLVPKHLSVYERFEETKIRELGKWGLRKIVHLHPHASSLTEHLENAFLNITTLMEIGAGDHFETNDASTSTDRNHLLSIPANTKKCLLVLVEKTPTTDDIFIVKSVASLISLKYKIENQKIPENSDAKSINVERKSSTSRIGLTERQIFIVAGIKKGFTNRQIADDLGFSESLIRQETLRIYKHFSVTGRTELIDIE
jgi:DNA-binding CsgD family transcriptional regulator